MTSPKFPGVSHGKVQRDRWQCKNCHRTRGLQVHHWYYERAGASLLGREDLDDLVTLCDTCHTALTRVRREVFGAGTREWRWAVKVLALVASVLIALWWWASH